MERSSASDTVSRCDGRQRFHCALASGFARETPLASSATGKDHAFLVETYFVVKKIKTLNYRCYRPVFLRGLVADANYDYFSLRFCGEYLGTTCSSVLI